MTTPRVTLEQWRALQAVVDFGGYAQAAAQLHRSQSTISYAVAQLEEKLGVAVLEVEGRKAHLTEAGELLLRRSRRLIEDALELEQQARGLAEGWEAEVRLVVDAAFPTGLLMEALKRFAPVSRGARVQLSEVVLSGADEALIEGRADLAICAAVPPGFLGDLLMEVEFIAVAHRRHPLHRLHHPLTLDDLRREMQVVIRDSGVHMKRDAGWLGAEHRWTVSSIDTAVDTVASGLGFGWLPVHQITAQLKDRTLVPLPLKVGQRRRAGLYMVYGRGDRTGPATHVLAEIFENLCSRSA